MRSLVRIAERLAVAVDERRVARGLELLGGSRGREGRAATAIIIPKTVEIPASSASGISSRTVRRFLSLGLAGAGSSGGCGGRKSGMSVRSSSLIGGVARRRRSAPRRSAAARRAASGGGDAHGARRHSPSARAAAQTSIGSMPVAASDPASQAAFLARNAAESLPAGALEQRLDERRARGPAAARQARPRPDRAGHPPRPHRRAPEAARVPGPRPPRRPDRRRLHRARRRPERPLATRGPC